MSTMKPLRRYSFLTPGEVHAKIRADLGVMGEVESIQGDVVILDGDYILDDVRVSVGGRTVKCVRSEDGIDYYLDGGALLNLRGFGSGGMGVDPLRRNMTQLLSGMFTECNQDRSRYVMWDRLSTAMFLVFFVSFITSGALTLFWLGALFGGGPALVLGLILLGAAVSCIGSTVMGMYFDERSKPNYDTAWPQYREEILQETVRIAKGNNVTYTGNLHVAPFEEKERRNPKPPKIRFNGRSIVGSEWTYETDGVSVERVKRAE